MSLTAHDSATHAFTPTIDGVALTPQRVSLPRPPVFASLAEERAHRKARLAGALRLFGRLGFAEGAAGHITARDPEFTDHFWVNPFAVSFRHIRVSDLILVNDTGQVVYGKHAVNKAAFVLHSAIHAARPEVVSAAHAHSPGGRAFSSLRIPLAPINQDACAFFEDHTVITEQAGVAVFRLEAGKEFAANFTAGKAAIHASHGMFSVGGSVDAAAYWFIAMERCCQAQLAAMAAGQPVDVTAENARYTADKTGTDLSGWVQFQSLWSEICHSDPDLFD